MKLYIVDENGNVLARVGEIVLYTRPISKPDKDELLRECRIEIDAHLNEPALVAAIDAALEADDETCTANTRRRRNDP